MAEAKVGTSKTGRRTRTRERRSSDEVVVEEAGEDRREGAARPAAAGERPVCGFALCPICAVLTAVGEVKPDLVEHLLLASREVLLAARALIDARLDGAGPPGGPRRLERLSIE